MLWDNISYIASSVGACPWILSGDFNMVRYSSEKYGGDLASTTAIWVLFSLSLISVMVLGLLLASLIEF